MNFFVVLFGVVLLLAPIGLVVGSVMFLASAAESRLHKVSVVLLWVGLFALIILLAIFAYLWSVGS